MNESNHTVALTDTRARVPNLAVRAVPMQEFEGESERKPSGLNLNDILFILVRHKWKIIFCALAGILAAASVFFLLPPQYETQAKLLVRYVVDRSAIDGLDQQGKTLVSPSESAINSEVEILTSSDLAIQVADAVGVDRLMPGDKGRATSADAALVIAKSLEVIPVKGSNIISVSYRNKDPVLASAVLQELVKRYFDKHLEVHRSLGAFDFVTRQSDQLRAELSQTEEDLQQLKAKAGITSLAEDTASLATELAKAQDNLANAESELASQKARVNEMEKFVLGVDAKSPGTVVPQPSSEILGEYQALVASVAQLRSQETELLSRYTAQNRVVTIKQAQIDELEKKRHTIEKKYPGLLGTVSNSGAPQSPRLDIVSERAGIPALESRVETLGARVKTLQEKAAALSEMGPKIAQLERKKEVEETNYKYYGASLEKARIDETLDPSRMPNISIVQAPSPPDRAKRDLKKVLFGLAGGGVAAGLSLALLIELVLDRTIKRPLELETRLSIPLLLSIPNFGTEGSRLRLPESTDDSQGRLTPHSLGTENGELLRPFCEAIRDRLGLYFEMNRMNHKPKLVAVTGLASNAGASTLAAGLAEALSDSVDGKVLLVDKPVAPKKFYDMMAQFKANDVDYVIFDMPSLGDTSTTLPMAAFMDKVLLVVEAEKSSRDAVKRAYAQLSAKADVSVIFNKTRSYGPKWLEGYI